MATTNRSDGDNSRITIEQVITTVEALFSKSNYNDPFENNEQDSEELFNDLLHSLVNSTRRITSKDDAHNLCKILHKLIFLCENEMSESQHSYNSTSSNSASRWKMLLLCLTYKRYHAKAPEAKYEAILNQKVDSATVAKRGTSVAGQGERLIFYTAVACMFRYEIQKQHQLQSSSSPPKTKQGPRSSARALQCLVQIAPHAGGTRDVCTIIEIGIRSILSNFIDQYNSRMELIGDSISSSALVAKALKATVVHLEEEGQEKQQGPSASSSLKEMLELAAKTLDHDLQIIQREQQQDKAPPEDEMPMKELPSTFNVFIPHNERGKAPSRKRRRNGNQKKKMTNRNLIQSVGELLVWSKTLSAMSNGAFTSGYEGLLQSESKMSFSSFSDPPESSSSQKNHKNHQKDCLHRMQTVVRNIRKGLNSYSRQHGYMLCNQYALDSTAITTSMITRAKAGDLRNLIILAKKKRNARALEKIHSGMSRHPDRVHPVESVRELMNSWVSLNGKQEQIQEQDDELTQMTLDIQQAKVRATIQYLRKMRIQEGKENLTANTERPIVIAALDDSLPNQVASVLTAAATNDWVLEDSSSTEGEEDIASSSKQTELDQVVLYLGETLTSISSFDDTMKLLNYLIVGRKNDSSSFDELGLMSNSSGVAAPSFASSDGIATTKCVVNLIDRYVKDGAVLILFTSADLRLPNDTMETLTQRGCSIHCHDADSFGERLSREGAQSGDISISLVWDTIDDLDLHVFMPSGEEICFSNTKSRCGLGVLDVDMNAGSPFSKAPVENVFLGKPEASVQAPKGKYKVVVQNYGYHEPKKRDLPIPWRIQIQINGEKKQYSGVCLGEGKASDETVCEFEYTGRTVPFPQELIEASAFGTSNLVNITASTGETLESLLQLMDTSKDLTELDRVRELVATPAEEEDSQDHSRRPLRANHLEVTNRDQLYMHLCKLPLRFHRMVEEALSEGEGGVTLAEKCAMDIATIMMKESIHISELEQLGYPDDVVGHVKDIMNKGSTPSSV
mmetsp:Transcript_22692/g.35001  ORF Transcript_22692/g.35001 Transcript_22692/m.35001 type:complete len:1020 (-) Transcript_22692:392-3451(-)